MRGSVVTVHQLGVRRGGTEILRALDLEVAAGESVALTGPSGSGKSTLLGCIAGTGIPTAGGVQVDDLRVSDLNTTKRAQFRRRKVGMMFQDADLLPELDVEENVALTLLFDGVGRQEALAAARQSLLALGMDGHARKRIDQVSRGEAQRVALARALVRDGVGLLIADEPTASLDPAGAASVADLVLSRARAIGATVILATHDMSVANRCDRVVAMQEINRPAVLA